MMDSSVSALSPGFGLEAAMAAVAQKNPAQKRAAKAKDEQRRIMDELGWQRENNEGIPQDACAHCSRKNALSNKSLPQEGSFSISREAPQSSF